MGVLFSCLSYFSALRAEDSRASWVTVRGVSGESGKNESGSTFSEAATTREPYLLWLYPGSSGDTGVTLSTIHAIQLYSQFPDLAFVIGR